MSQWHGLGYIKTKDLFNNTSEIAGRDAAMKVFQVFSGELVTLNKRDSSFMMLLENHSSKKAADEFFSKYRNNQFYVCKYESLLREQRNIKMIELYKSGANIKDIAKQFNITWVMVYRIIQNAKRCQQ